jgi:hypothetical protein
MMTAPNMCLACQHYTIQETQDDTEQRPCAAFPGGIPDAIWAGHAAHFDPVADEPVQFELRPGSDWLLDSYLHYWFELAPELDQGA